MPEKPLMLVRLRANVTEEPAVIVTLLGFVDRTKLGVVMVENMADSIASGTALGEPLATVTQTGGAAVGAGGGTPTRWEARGGAERLFLVLVGGWKGWALSGGPGIPSPCPTA